MYFLRAKIDEFCFVFCLWTHMIVGGRESLRDFHPSPLQQIRPKTRENPIEIDSRLGPYSHKIDPKWTMDGDY